MAEKTIIAPKGKLYQNVNDIYVCGKEIHLGINDTEANWQLINEADKPIRPEPEEEEL
jgi:hypothetical protein